MADFFALFGIAVIVLLVDALVCCLQILIADAWEDDDVWWFLPLLTNAVGLAISLAFHIFNHMR